MNSLRGRFKKSFNEGLAAQITQRCDLCGFFYAIIASVLVIRALSFTVNWGYLGHFCGMAKDAVAEFSTDCNEAGQAFVAEVTNTRVRESLLMLGIL